MLIKLHIAEDDYTARRILDNAARVARRCAAWPAWKRNGVEPAKEVRDATRFR
jgi:hypothetical protein